MRGVVSSCRGGAGQVERKSLHTGDSGRRPAPNPQPVGHGWNDHITYDLQQDTSENERENRSIPGGPCKPSILAMDLWDFLIYFKGQHITCTRSVSPRWMCLAYVYTIFQRNADEIMISTHLFKVTKSALAVSSVSIGSPKYSNHTKYKYATINWQGVPAVQKVGTAGWRSHWRILNRGICILHGVFCGRWPGGGWNQTPVKRALSIQEEMNRAWATPCQWGRGSITDLREISQTGSTRLGWLGVEVNEETPRTQSTEESTGVEGKMVRCGAKDGMESSGRDGWEDGATWERVQTLILLWCCKNSTSYIIGIWNTHQK